MATIDQLKHSYLTGVINLLKAPAGFVHNRMYNNHQTIPTEDIELGVITNSREAAPYIKKNGEGILTKGATEKFQTVSAPNIRLKRAFEPSELLFGRRPGNNIFVSGIGDIISEIDAYIARELSILNDQIANAQEVQACQSLTGVVSYSVNTGDVWRVTFPRDSTLAFDLGAGNYWVTTTVNPETTAYNVKAIMSELDGFQPSIVILGATAAAHFRANPFVTNTLALYSNQGIGRAVYDQFFAEGAIPLGNLHGLEYWAYPRKMLVNGSSVDLINPKFAYYISMSPAAQFVEYFAAIPDLDALEGRLLQAEKFAKSWRIPDPSSQVNLVASRPLVCMRIPNATAAVQVVA